MGTHDEDFLQPVLIYGDDEKAVEAYIHERTKGYSPIRRCELGTDGALGIQDILAIRGQAFLASGEGIDVFILHGADTMTNEAANSLLKILEEPPRSTLFILRSSSYAVLPTILSRVAEHSFFLTTQTGEHPIARLKQKLEDEIFKTGRVSEATYRALSQAVLLDDSRISGRYAMDFYTFLAS